jgi:hypothetical protein
MVEVSAENITLITVVTFLSVFMICAMFIPWGIVIGSQSSEQEGRVIQVPKYFEGIDLQNFAETHVVNLTHGKDLEDYEFKLGGWNVRVEDFGDDHEPPYGKWLYIRTQAEWWIFRWDFKYFRWYDKEGVMRSVDNGAVNPFETYHVINYREFDEAYRKWGKDGLRWTIKNDYTQMVVYLGWNFTKYATPTDALLAGEFSMLLCINFDKVNTSFNAWNLIGSILFFQMPNVHPLLNAIIAIPVWIAIAWLIYILIVKIIPFVGG